MGSVVVACEFSGVVRDAFIRAGHDAVSVDLIPSESPNGRHVIGDALEYLETVTPDLVIAHPPCTYLANSGARWLWRGGGFTIDEDRWSKMEDAAMFVRAFLELDVPRVAVENPTMHRYGQRIIGEGPAFSIQPWQFGHGEIKRTCFWTRNLPTLEPTEIVDGRTPRVHHAAPSDTRWMERSRTLVGIADAMAAQWGALL